MVPSESIAAYPTDRALGYEADCREATARSLTALDELRKDGWLAHFDEGPGTFNHTTLCYVPVTG
jgi:hypothetical protein